MLESYSQSDRSEEWLVRTSRTVPLPLLALNLKHCLLNDLHTYYITIYNIVLQTPHKIYEVDRAGMMLYSLDEKTEALEIEPQWSQLSLFT